MTFILAAGLLLILVLALLVRAVLREPRVRRSDDMQGRLEAELAGDVAAGVLPAEDLSDAMRDLDAKVSRESSPPIRRHAGPWVWVLIVLVALGGAALYWQTGNWRAAIHGDRAAVLHRADTMLAELQAHLEAHPDDENGWITLGRAKSAMGDYTAAALAYARAVKLDREQAPNLLAAWGEAQVLADPGHPTEHERAIFAAVLKSDPDNIRGLWYGGLLALDAGEREQAIAHWRRLLNQKIPAPMAAFIKSHLVALGAPATAATPLAATSGPKIVLTIKLAPALGAQVKPGEVLFVFVRNPAGGPPLAAKRLQTTQFPMQITLGNGDAMLAGRNLSSMTDKTVEVGVLVSASGDATPKPGDLAGSQNIELRSGKQLLTLEIGRIVGATPGA